MVTMSLSPLPIQFTETEFGSDKKQYGGLSFVINAGGNWYKDMGMDFYVAARASAPVKVRHLSGHTPQHGGEGWEWGVRLVW